MTNFLEYRVRYRNAEESGVAYGLTLNGLRKSMNLFKITGKYLMEGFDGLLWIQLEKSQDYDIN